MHRRNGSLARAPSDVNGDIETYRKQGCDRIETLGLNASGVATGINCEEAVSVKEDISGWCIESQIRDCEVSGRG